MQIPVFPMNVEEFFKVYPEVKITPEEFAAWKADRQGIVIGQVLADTLRLEEGRSHSDQVVDLPQGERQRHLGIQHRRASTRWRTARLGQPERDVPLRLLQRVAAVRPDQIGWMTIKVKDPDESEAVAKRIDALFANSSDETKTGDGEGVHQAVHGADRQHRQDPGVGGLRGVLHHAAGHRQHHGAVGARAHQRDRRAEDARVQLGQRSCGSCIGEALFLTIVGGLIGFGLAYLAVGGIAAYDEELLPGLRDRQQHHHHRRSCS